MEAMFVNGERIEQPKLNRYELSIKMFGSEERFHFEVEAENKQDAKEKGRIEVINNNFFNPWFYNVNDIRVEKKLKPIKDKE